MRRHPGWRSVRGIAERSPSGCRIKWAFPSTLYWRLTEAPFDPAMLRSLPLHLITSLSFAVFALGLPVDSPAQRAFSTSSGALQEHDARVLILGGGVAGVIAARTLHEQGISDFIIVEARDQLGGRLMGHTLSADGGKPYNVEVGANWVQGTQASVGPENPIWALAQKHKIRSHLTNLSSISGYIILWVDLGADVHSPQRHMMKPDP